MIIEGLKHFFLVYGYFLAVPVMIIEGPVATMVMAALASLGYFNIGLVFLLGFTADLVSDFVYYQIGVSGGHKVIAFLSKIFGFNINLIENLRWRFQNHGAKAIFVAKLLPGVVPPVFIAAGLAKYPVRKLYRYAVPAGILWTAILAFIGFYFGRHLRNIQSLLSRTGIILAIVVIVVILFQYIFGKRLARRALASEESKNADTGKDIKI